MVTTSTASEMAKISAIALLKYQADKKNRCAKCFVYGYDQDDDEVVFFTQ